MKVGSLFSGIGGLELGLEQAGMEIVWQVEFDKYATSILEKHWPEVKRYGDITKVKKIEKVDLICGGFPCQDVSLAGQRRGLEGKRSGLWWEYARIIRLVRPKYVLVENVQGLLSQGLGTVLGELSTLGYDAEWQTLSAKQFGAPHLRKRVFILAYANGLGRDAGKYRGRREPILSGRSQNTHANKPSKKALQTRARKSRKDKLEGCACEREVWACSQACEEKRLSRAKIRRISHGVPRQVERLKCLGNAVVPACSQWIGERIMENEQ